MVHVVYVLWAWPMTIKTVQFNAIQFRGQYIQKKNDKACNKAKSNRTYTRCTYTLRLLSQHGYRRYTYALATIDRAITADGGTHIICVAGVLEPECAYTGAWAIAKMATGLRLTDEHRDVDTGAPT